MAETQKLQFSYLNFRGLGQPIRFLLEYLGVQYDEKNFDRQHWFEVDKEQHKQQGFTFANLPFIKDVNNLSNFFLILVNIRAVCQNITLIIINRVNFGCLNRGPSWYILHKSLEPATCLARTQLLRPEYTSFSADLKATSGKLYQSFSTRNIKKRRPKCMRSKWHTSI